MITDKTALKYAEKLKEYGLMLKEEGLIVCDSFVNTCDGCFLSDQLCNIANSDMINSDFNEIIDVIKERIKS